MKHIKRLGLLALAAMVVAAFVGTATAAAETAGAFTTDKQGNQLKTTTLEKHVFTVTGSTVECAQISFAGTAAASGSSSQSVKPSYKECTAGGFAATVNTAGCDYKFTATTTGNPANTSETHAPVHLENCEAGGIVISVSNFFAKCKILVKNQTVPDAIHYTNATVGTASEDIQVTVTADEVHAEVTESSGLCPVAVGTHTNATYTGKSTVQVEGGKISHSKL